MFQDLVNKIVYILPAVLIALCCHEFAHSYVAYKLGDVSQKDAGRLSLNPIRHLDPVGTLCLLITGFGWAKPVMVDPYFFKDKKNGMIYSAMAGPVANLIVGFLAVILNVIVTHFNVLPNNMIGVYIILLLYYTAMINIGLGVFNLIPLPPLDGSKILMGILPEETYFKVLQYEQIISFVLIGLLVFGILDGPLGHAREVIMNLYFNVANGLIGIIG